MKKPSFLKFVIKILAGGEINNNTQKSGQQNWELQSSDLILQRNTRLEEGTVRLERWKVIRGLGFTL